MRKIKIQLIGISAILVAAIAHGANGEPDNKTSVTAVEHKRRTIYHSPQSPGFTCWTGLWAMPDKSLMLAFTQATGPLKGRPKAPAKIRSRLNWPPTGRENYDMTGLDLSNVYLKSDDHGTTWKKFSQDHFRSCMNGAAYHRSQLALPNGTIVRCIWGRYLPYENPPVPQTGLSQRSDDGSRNWQPLKVILDPKKYTMLVTKLKLLSDGRILAIGGIANVPADNQLSRYELSAKQYPGMLVSNDNARTWSQPITVVPPDHAKNWGGEEFDVAELAGGDLLCVYRRIDPASAKRREVRWQGLLKKQGDTWTAKRVEAAPFPHSGHPNLLATREGLVLHIATSGIHWTNDAGRSWHQLDVPGTRYYPDSLQGPDGKIYISAHVGGDNAYGSVDQSIMLDTFRLQVTR
jgi:hypothetical protein